MIQAVTCVLCLILDLIMAYAFNQSIQPFKFDYDLIHLLVCCMETQLPNAALSKVPTLLVAMSVVACFTAALVSLALSFSIVPRQVMPWTGLFLVYEWTFTIFFLLFGGYLYVIGQWGKYVAHQSSSFLSHPESPEYDSGKGIYYFRKIMKLSFFAFCFVRLLELC